MELNFFPKKVALLLAACFLPVLLLPAQALPQETAATDSAISMTDLSLQELMQVEVPTVYGASRYRQTVAEAPASVTVITADEIKMYGYRNLAELLQSVRGFSMSYDRNYNYIGIRGFSRPGDYNTRVLLLVDGIRSNDDVYDEAAVGNDFPVDIDLIDRVEVIRGPAQSLYGSNAFFGVINVITKNGHALNGGELSGDAGSFSTYKGRLSYGRKYKNGLEALLSGSFLESTGQNLYYKEFDTPDQNNGRAIGDDGERYGSGFLKLRYRDWTLEGGYLRRRKNVPTGSFGTVFDSNLNKTVDEHAFADLKFEHEYESRLAVMTRLSFNRYHYDGDYLYRQPQGNVLNRDLSRGDALSSELQITKELERHKVVAGLELRENFRQDQGNYDQGGTVYLDDRRNSRSFGIYAQDDYTLLDDLVLHGGLRYDHFDSFGGTVNPRLALVYSPLSDTTVKLIYGRAFRAPNAYELYYSAPPDYLRNPSLRQESDTSYEAVLEQGLGGNLTGSMSLFYNSLSNVISQSELADGSHIFQNIDDYTTKGIDFELQGKWQNGIQGRGSYTLQQATRSGASTGVPNSPRQLAKLNLIIPVHPKKAFLGLEEQYTDKRRTLSGEYLPGFFVTNLTLFSRQLFKRLELSGSIYNLFDKRHSDPGSEDHLQEGIEQDGRSLRVKATYAF